MSAVYVINVLSLEVSLLSLMEVNEIVSNNKYYNDDNSNNDNCIHAIKYYTIESIANTIIVL